MRILILAAALLGQVPGQRASYKLGPESSALLEKFDRQLYETAKEISSWVPAAEKKHNDASSRMHALEAEIANQPSAPPDMGPDDPEFRRLAVTALNTSDKLLVLCDQVKASSAELVRLSRLEVKKIDDLLRLASQLEQRPEPDARQAAADCRSRVPISVAQIELAATAMVAAQTEQDAKCDRIRRSAVEGRKWLKSH